MVSYSPTNIFHGHKLEIHDLKALSKILYALSTNPSQARNTTAVEVHHDSPPDPELKDVKSDTGSPLSTHSLAYADSEIAKIINKIWSNGGLESFRWTGSAIDDVRVKRSPLFWEALWKSASTLKNLDLKFYVHELHDMGQIIPTSVNFTTLKSLYLDANMAHGDNGALVDQVLRNSSGVIDLTLYFPNCDLENCRLSGISWEYTFPVLESFTLMTYNSNSPSLSDFLVRHPSITTLTWNVYADDVFIFPPNSLSNLQNLNVDFHGETELVKALRNTGPIAHLRVDGCPHTSYADLTNLAETLRCLELDSCISDWRASSDFIAQDNIDAGGKEREEILPLLPGIIKTLLPQLHQLRELSVDLETSRTYCTGDNGESCHPRPMDVSDLKLILSLLPTNTKIRALRISDSLGLKLPNEVLEDFPDIPKSLEYLQWEIGENRENFLLYRLVRGEGQIKAVESQPLRTAKGSKELWTENKILDL